MADFQTCVRYGLEKMCVNFELKDKQIEILSSLYEAKDCIGVLPTGYGKSIIFQLLPYVMQKKYGKDEPMIVLIVTPLNSIMEDQVQSLRAKGFMACYLSYAGKGGFSYDEEEDADGEDVSMESNKVLLPTSVTMEQLMRGQYHHIYAHPESLINNKTMSAMMRTSVFQERICAIVIDEVHMVAEWGHQFRPAFKQLGETTCVLPHVGHLALTATATESRITELGKILQYKSPVIITTNPDRPNIYIEVRKRLPNNRKYEKYDEFIEPIAMQLKKEQHRFPLTIVYMESLEALGYCYQFLAHILKDEQYSGESIPENRIFAQYHKDYTSEMKRHIVAELMKINPKIRLVLATVALGMGLNAPSVCTIIHCRPPTTLESYMQEIGRAGRQGQPANATMYFNNSDLSKSRKGLSDDIVRFCRNDTTCLRLQLVNYFGFDHVIFSGSRENCCSNCRSASDQ